MKKPHITLAVDPDVTKSGLATLKDNALRVETLSFPTLISTICLHQAYAFQNGHELQVIVEAGWLIHGHWHSSPTDTKQSAAAKGNATGRNHETGRKIVEMLEFYNIPVKCAKPLRKQWKGADKKITHAELQSICKARGIDLQAKRTNQEERDAALLAIVFD